MAYSHSSVPGTGTNTACPECGKLSQDITPMGPFARLFCVCHSCDRAWWAA